MPSFAHIQEEISNMLSIPDEELTQEQRDIMEEYLDELSQQESDKIDAFVSFLRQEQARANFMKQEAKRLSSSATCIDKKLERLKDYYRGVMQALGLKKVSGKVYSASVRATPVAFIKNEQAIPNNFWKTKTETSLDKIAIRDALKAGDVVPGAELGHSYSLITK